MPPSLATGGAPGGLAAPAAAPRTGWFARLLDWVLRRG
jgi:hypothetical protein